MPRAEASNASKRAARALFFYEAGAGRWQRLRPGRHQMQFREYLAYGPSNARTRAGFASELEWFGKSLYLHTGQACLSPARFDGRFVRK